MSNTVQRNVVRPIRWRLVLGVVALQVALQLGWMIYRTYQPALLTEHGLALLLPLLPLLGLAYSLVATSLTAMALATLPAGFAGLGAGLVLGGSGGAATILSLAFGGSGTVAVAPLLVVVALATGVALGLAARLARADSGAATRVGMP